MTTMSDLDPFTVPDASPEAMAADDYLAIVAHDLRTPLTVIKGYASALLNPALSRDDERRATCARRIADAVDHMTRLIDGLLTAARVYRVCVDLDELVSAAVARARERANSRRIHVIVPRAPVLVDVDPDLIECVLDNLLDNALKYSPDGREISAGVRIVGEWSRDGEQFPGATGQHRWAILWVRDQGIGIPRDQVRRIFERSTRIHQPGASHVPGSGLGLYICKRIVQAHGGRIWVVSQPGRGSIFHVGLPGVHPPSRDACPWEEGVAMSVEQAVDYALEEQKG
jgi:two-component system sensor histidine kinase VicK